MPVLVEVFIMNIVFFGLPYAIQYQWLAMRLVLPVYKLGIYLSLHDLHFSTHNTC